MNSMKTQNQNWRLPRLKRQDLNAARTDGNSSTQLRMQMEESEVIEIKMNSREMRD